MKLSDLSFKTPEELQKWMQSNISYRNFSSCMSPEEVFKKKAGSCHDQVVFTEYFFKKMKLKYGKLFFMEYDKGKGAGGMTHTLIFFYKDDEMYWFENSWDSERGINGPYKNLSDLKKDVKKKFMKISKYDSMFFSRKVLLKEGMNLQEIVDSTN